MALGPSPSSGEALEVVDLPSGTISTSGSATTRASAFWTSSVVSPGRIRQFTFADAEAGSTFLEVPPETCVGTHVVRSSATTAGRKAKAAMASGGTVSFDDAIAFIASAMAPVSLRAASLNQVRAAGTSFGGNGLRSIRSSARASRTMAFPGRGADEWPPAPFTRTAKSW
jgi:hypothetical protein